MLLNCDLGESFGRWEMGSDAEVMPHINQANIACGMHAGDPVVMQQTLLLAKRHNVSVGAHPSYPDRQGFGRRSMQLDENELTALLHYQIATLQGMASVHSLRLDYVKPHGALYNDMMRDANLRATIMQAVSTYPEPLKLMLQASSDSTVHQQQAQEFGLSLYFEAFADRCYTDDGLLVPRNQSGAVLSAKQMFAQVRRLRDEGIVISQSGKSIPLQVDSLCVHGDNAEGVAQIKALAELLGQ